MSERVEAVRLAQMPGASVSAIARRFHISRKTLYKWLSRHRAAAKTAAACHGRGLIRGVAAADAEEAALADRSRRPRSSPRQLRPSQEAPLVELRKKHPAWGPRKLLRRLADIGAPLEISLSTATAVLRRHGLIRPEASLARREFIRFEAAAPNDLWQMDFKGHLGLARGGSCHPLTMLDDHSRYCLALEACPDQTTATVQPHLARVFKAHGLPRRILCDNGSPWGTSGNQIQDQWTPLTVWLLRLGVQVSHGRPRHPQTQGKEERFHRTLVDEVLGWLDPRKPFWDLPESGRIFASWRGVYNHERPHEGIGMLVPARRYVPSPRELPERLPAIEYGADTQVRRVTGHKGIMFHGKRYAMGRPFVGLDVGLRATGADGVWDVYFCQAHLGRIDERTGEVIGRPRQAQEVAALPPVPDGDTQGP